MAKPPGARAAGGASKRTKATAKDVATLAGVSRTAVSMVINGSADGNIAPDKQERIRAAMAELNYTPNTVARNLRSQSTQSLGVISDAIASSPWAGAMLLAATEYALQRGYVTLHIETGDDERPELRVAKMAAGAATLRGREVDGLALFTMGHDALRLGASLGAGPFAVGNCRDESGAYPSFIPDDEQGGFDAAQHLIDAGHRDLVMLAGDDHTEAAVLRTRGFGRALKRAGLPHEPHRVVLSDWGIHNGYRATAAVLARPHPPTALFCINDRVATGAYLAAAHAGLDVPRDLSIIGFDDEIKLAAELTPGLSTMALPHVEMGVRTMQCLIEQVENPADPGATKPRVTKLLCPLVTRGSVSEPAGR
ncbi:LacI family DNA-binding transcriptional regulator [Micrococcales bacterium 31B]|nr:LacI family DNA-binding transcriptional regulator [Micrococcales bacterium 31B]